MICMSRTQYIPATLGYRIARNFNETCKKSPRIYFDGDGLGAVKNFVFDTRAASNEGKHFNEAETMKELEEFGFINRTFLQKAFLKSRGYMAANFNASKKLMKKYLEEFEKDLEYRQNCRLPEAEAELKKFTEIDGDIEKYLVSEFGFAKRIDYNHVFVKHEKDINFKKSFRFYHYAKNMKFGKIDGVDGYFAELEDVPRLEQRIKRKIRYAEDDVKDRQKDIERVKEVVEFIKNL